MENNLFRKKSLEHISSPEQLHDYMRVTSPRLWMVLSAVVALLIGFIVFACTTRMENTRTLKFQVEYGWISSLISAEDTDLVKIHMPVRINGKTGTIAYLDMNSRIRVNISFDDGSTPKDGFYTLEFPDDPKITEENPMMGMLTISNGIALLHEEDNLLDYLSTDRRIRMDGKLGTITNAVSYDVTSFSVTMDNPDEVLPDGIYDGEVITESTTPINFLLN